MLSPSWEEFRCTKMTPRRPGRGSTAGRRRLASVNEIPVLIVDGGPIGMALALSFDTRASNALWLSEEMAPSPIQN